ncbi:MAG: hypothetical protein RJA99_3325 [Pseudomonadota bacterium]|jgi:hypothetical protein
MTHRLATTFSRRSAALHSDVPLTEEQIRRVAPSIFAPDKHASRSARYTYLPTIEILRRLAAEGFTPYAVTQSQTRDDAHREHTKHMVRLRRPDASGAAQANEVVLINSHNGASSYQMLGGVFRFVCRNGLVCGDVHAEVRVPHKGDVLGEVIDGANLIVERFDSIDASREAMQAVPLDAPEQAAFARAALALRYPDADDARPAPVTESQLLAARRPEDTAPDLWTVFNRVQEHLIRGGLPARSPRGRRQHTRPVRGIDSNVQLNRALWVLAEAMRRLAA